MEWIILESLVVLALGLAIVWWTMSGPRGRKRDEERPPRDDDTGRGQ